jgi:hypothetical protein
MTDELHSSNPEFLERQLQDRKLKLRAMRTRTEQHRVANESINTLLSVVRYLNSVQDGDSLRIDATYSRTDIDKPSRNLNGHEEDIMNASLIAMKRLIASLIPVSIQAAQRPLPVAVDSTASVEER